MELGDFVESLYRAANFEDAFAVYDKEVKALGFEAVLYTVIPKIVIEQSLRPVYAVSKDFCPEFLHHYESARFDRHDPLIKAAYGGESQAIDWSGSLIQKYATEKESQEVLDTALGYGIRNGLTIPLMADARGISGASFISSEPRSSFQKLLREKQTRLKLRTDLFHSLVLANSPFTDQFAKPVLENLSETEKAYLAHLAAGRSSQQAASELRLSEKYLEQVMLKIRRKLSGVGAHEAPKINRNQVLFYAGSMRFFE